MNGVAMKRAFRAVCLCMLGGMAEIASAIPRSSIADPCADEVLSDMVRRGTEGARSGHCDMDGNFAVAAVVIEGDGAQAYEKAKLAAVRMIAESLGLQVSGETVNDDTSATKDGASSFSSFFSSKSSSSVHETLAGVAARGVVEAGSRRLAMFAMTQRDIERRGELKRSLTLKTDAPATVQAVGMAMVRDLRTDIAQQVAVNSAKRQAVEMVMGAMMIGQTSVADSSTDGKERFGSYVFTSSAGFIDSYRVLEEHQDATIYTVRIEATIDPKKLFDSYREHLRSIGNPIFAIEAHGDSRLLSALKEFFHGKGFRIQEGIDGSDYLIDAMMKYTPVKDPGDVTGGRTGVRGELAWNIVSSVTRESISQLQTDGRSSCFVGSDTERQMDLVLEQILGKEGPRLHRKLQDLVAELLAGRTVFLKFEAVADLADDAVRGRFTELLLGYPQFRDINSRWNAPDLEIEASVIGRIDHVADDIVSMILQAGGKNQVRILVKTHSEIRFASP